MDGTLYNSMPNHAKAWMRLMTEKGVEATEEEFFLYEGMTGAAIIDKMIRRSLGREAAESEKKDWYALKAKYFVEMPPVSLIDGAIDIVAELRRRGIDTILVTGSGQNSLLSRLEEDFPGVFPPTKRVTSASVKRGKPYPDPYLCGLELAGVRATEAIAIDNAPLGVASGNAAGILTVGVVTGPLEAHDLYAGGAHVVYNSMRECADFLPGLLNIIETITH